MSIWISELELKSHVTRESHELASVSAKRVPSASTVSARRA
jgi:hypothetical protein